MATNLNSLRRCSGRSPSPPMPPPGTAGVRAESHRAGPCGLRDGGRRAPPQPDGDAARRRLLRPGRCGDGLRLRRHPGRSRVVHHRRVEDQLPPGRAQGEVDCRGQGRQGGQRPGLRRVRCHRPGRQVGGTGGEYLHETAEAGPTADVPPLAKGRNDGNQRDGSCWPTRVLSGAVLGGVLVWRIGAQRPEVSDERLDHGDPFVDRQ